MAIALVAALLFPATRVAAQGATATSLKAAFLYNFANFTQWPAAVLAPEQRLLLCVVNDKQVADALEQIINGRSVDKHELVVEVVNADGPVSACHLLYVAHLEEKQTASLLGSLKQTSTFSVGDGDRFAEMGGVAQLILDNGRMRFAVNVDSARRARLNISSKLLSLAKIVKD